MEITPTMEMRTNCPYEADMLVFVGMIARLHEMAEYCFLLFMLLHTFVNMLLPLP
jgi:hypothetical protein